MPRNNWTYMLRLLRRNPERIRMDRLALYMQEFAELLGVENQPVFRKIVRASTGIAAAVPSAHQKRSAERLHVAKTKPDSNPGRNLRMIETMLGEDSIKTAELLDTSRNVVYLFKADVPGVADGARVVQTGVVDGTITGLVGADDTMHLHLRDQQDRDLRFVVRDETMARKLLTHFRQGLVRLCVHGSWRRTDQGWVPESNRCTVDSFELLDATPLSEIFRSLTKVPGNGWLTLDDPQAAWRDLRGVN